AVGQRVSLACDFSPLRHPAERRRHGGARRARAAAHRLAHDALRVAHAPHGLPHRINVSNARLAGLYKDLHMIDTVWSAGISTFYVGYLIGQLPGKMIMAKTNPRCFMPAAMRMWSAGTICMAAMTSAMLTWCAQRRRPCALSLLRWVVGSALLPGPD
ncbi:transporter, partial [Tolypocladium capitatum]